MRIVGRMEKTGRQNLLSRQSDRENGSWILGGGESEVHPRRDCSARSGKLETSVDSEREEDANGQSHWSSWRLRGEPCTEQPWESRCTCAKSVLTPCTASQETARKITCLRESDEMNVKNIAEIPERCPERKVLNRDQQISSVRERVHRQRLGRTTPNVQEHKTVESRSAEARTRLFAWSKTQQSVSLSFCRSRIVYTLTTGISQRDGDKTSVERTVDTM